MKHSLTDEHIQELISEGIPVPKVLNSATAKDTLNYIQHHFAIDSNHSKPVSDIMRSAINVLQHVGLASRMDGDKRQVTKSRPVGEAFDLGDAQPLVPSIEEHMGGLDSQGFKILASHFGNSGVLRKSKVSPPINLNSLLS